MQLCSQSAVCHHVITLPAPTHLCIMCIPESNYKLSPRASPKSDYSDLPTRIPDVFTHYIYSCHNLIISSTTTHHQLGLLLVTLCHPVGCTLTYCLVFEPSKPVITTVNVQSCRRAEVMLSLSDLEHFSAGRKLTDFSLGFLVC